LRMWCIPHTLACLSSDRVTAAEWSLVRAAIENQKFPNDKL